MLSLEKQLENFRTGFPYLKVVDSASVGNGIARLSRKSKEHALLAYSQYISNNGKVCKFVPASGAASRMFKDIYAGLDYMRTHNEPLPEDHPCSVFIRNINNFCLFDVEDLLAMLLEKDGLNLGSTPKGLIHFHDYGEFARTPFEEHLVEGARYAKMKNGQVSLHYTVSKEHLKDFKELLNFVKPSYEEYYGCRFNVRFSIQDPESDMVAVDMDNNPFVKADGKVLYRPAGHGALIENLNTVKENIIVIKNIDNITVENKLESTVLWKKILIGRALQLQSKCHMYMAVLDSMGVDALDDYLSQIRIFLKKEFAIDIPEGLDRQQTYEKLIEKLNRPVRVCGMVKNEGEPGGGPYIIGEEDGTTSLQILEKAQLNTKDAAINDMVKRSTHFNPVDLVCAVYDYRGKKFDLNMYVDDSTGFISEKSYEGRPLKAQELPGLWNGAMSRWNTSFVEVPVSTFNPVKTVLDLLRPAHRVN